MVSLSCRAIKHGHGFLVMQSNKTRSWFPCHAEQYNTVMVFLLVLSFGCLFLPFIFRPCLIFILDIHYIFHTDTSYNLVYLVKTNIINMLDIMHIREKALETSYTCWDSRIMHTLFVTWFSNWCTLEAP